MNIAFLGYLTTEEAVLESASLSLADNRMQHAYVAAMERELGDVSTFSTLDPTLGSGRLRRYWRLLARIRVWAREEGTEPRVLLYYNTFTAQCLIGRYLQRWHRVTVVPVTITLPYAFLESPPLWHRLQHRLTRHLATRADGIVAISPFLADEIAPGVPALVVRGGVPEQRLADLGRRTKASGATVHITYAGTLYERYHIADALAMMEHLDDRFRLDVYGRGPLADLVRQAAAHDARIRYHGVVSEQEVREALAESDVVLVLLDTDDRLARNSFPSKVFEAMASGAAVLVSDLPTLDAGMRDGLTVVDDLAPSTLAGAVRALDSRAAGEVTAAADRVRAYLDESGTWEAVGRRLRPFLLETTHPA